MMYKRDYLHNLAIKSNDPTKSNELWQNYRKEKNQITCKINKAKKEFYANIDTQFINKPKELWKQIKLTMPKKSNEVINDISPNVFNEYFATIGSQVAKDIEFKTSDFEPKFPDSIYTFKFSEINEGFVQQFLMSLASDSKNDVLNFDTRLLRLAPHIITPTLTILINLSLKSGHSPEDWKTACVTPAFKGEGDPLHETNYRPLSVIAHLAKMVEKSVQLQLLEYLTSHKFISIDQFAYLKLHSTQLCLHRMVDDILENINAREKTVLCFLDIKKNVLIQ